MVFSHTDDIAEVVATALLNLDFKGHSVRYISSDVRSFGDVAKTLGNAIGNPGLPWIEFTDEQTLGALKEAGLHEEIAKNYTEMGAAIRTGKMQEDYLKQTVSNSGKVKLEDFAKSFATAYNN
jgi:nucleoside-diphosphate-sugar epimerase